MILSNPEQQKVLFFSAFCNVYRQWRRNYIQFELLNADGSISNLASSIADWSQSGHQTAKICSNLQRIHRQRRLQSIWSAEKVTRGLSGRRLWLWRSWHFGREPSKEDMKAGKKRVKNGLLVKLSDHLFSNNIIQAEYVRCWKHQTKGKKKKNITIFKITPEEVEFKNHKPTIATNQKGQIHDWIYSQ